MDLNTLLITPISGAIIGYFTNWIAIKMLFRPYEEKKIFGFRIPFTPGLMPKERFVLSNKIGTTLADNVLTTEAIMETVLKDEQAIENLLDRYLEKIMSKPLTISDVVNKIPTRGGELISLYIKAGDMLEEKIKNPDILDKISGLVCKAIIQLAKSEDAFLISGKLMNALKPKIIESATKHFKTTIDNPAEALSMEHKPNEVHHVSKLISEAIMKRLNSLRAEESDLSELIPEKAVDIVKNIIKDRLPRLAETVKNLPYNNPRVDTALRELTGKLIDENLGAVAGFFVNKDKIYSSLRFALFEYLTYNENIDELYDKLEEMIDNLMMRKLSDIMPEDEDEQFRVWLTKTISDNISSDLIEKIITFIFDSAAGHLRSRQAESIDDIISKFMPGYETRLYNYISIRIGEFLGSNSRKLADGLMTMLISGSGGIQNFRIDKFLLSLGSDKLNSIKQTLARYIKLMLEKGLKTLFAGLDIAKITEDQINKMDMREVEDLVIGVAKRELKAITNLGALLGLIIGFMPALMSMFK